ncbi:MAG: pilin [Patescibacteria group bacterium]
MKKFIILILAAFIIFVPQISEADEAEEYQESETYNINVIGEDQQGDPISGSLEVEYDGMVPCGRCLSVESSSGDIQNFFSKELDEIHRCSSEALGKGGSSPETFVPCSLCHLFMIFDRVISFVLGGLIPAIALIVIVGAGVTMIVSTGNPEKTNKAIDALKYAALGLFLAYFSWAIITLIISGFMDWEIEWGSEGIKTQPMCEVEIERPSDMELPSED